MAGLRVSFNKRKTRYNETITFGGVDLTTPQMSVASNRALDMSNYVYRDNALQKRYGYKKHISKRYYYIDESGSVVNYVDENAGVYDIWNFGEYVIVHKGAMLFYYKKSNKFSLNPVNIGNKIISKGGSTVVYYLCHPVPEHRISAFFGNDRLWLLTGEEYLVLEESPSEDVVCPLVVKDALEYAYVPTTTIGITQSEASVGGNRQTYESPNLLTRLRKNGIVGGIENASACTDKVAKTYVLDSAISPKGDTYSEKIADVEENFEINIEATGIYVNGYTLKGHNEWIMPRYGQKVYINKGYVKAYFGGTPFIFIDNDGVKRTTQYITPDMALAEVKFAVGSDTAPTITNPDDLVEGYYYVTAIDSNAVVVYPDTEDKSWSNDALKGRTNVTFYLSAKVNGVIYQNSFKLYISDSSYMYIYGNFKTNYYDYAGNIWAGVDNNPSSATCTFAVLGIVGYVVSYEGDGTVFDMYNPTDYAGKHSSYFINHGTNPITDDRITPTFYGENFLNNGKVHLVAKKIPSDGDVVKHDELYNGEFSRYVNDNPLPSTSFFALLCSDEKDNATATIYGYIVPTRDSLYSENIVMFISPSGSVDGDSNIEVTFPVYDEGSEGKIEGCTIGTMFGAEGFVDRLFVSGNSENKNCLWHTTDSGEDGMFNYFPDDGVISLGLQSNEIVVMGIVNDGKLLVAKKSDTRDTTIYYISGSYTNATDDNGNTLTTSNGQTIQKETYTWVRGSSRMGAVAQHLSCDFNGDFLFVDNMGHIVGFDVTGTTNDNQRVASSRSNAIDKVIMAIKSPKDTCFLAEDENELFYFTPSCTYYQNYEGNQWYSSKEWFKTDMENVIAYAHVRETDSDYQLFGTSDGYIYESNPNTFSDTLEEQVTAGNIHVTRNGDILLTNATDKYENGFTRLTIESLYNLVETFTSSLPTVDSVVRNDHTLVLNSDNIQIGRKYYFTNGTTSFIDYLDVAEYDDVSNFNNIQKGYGVYNLRENKLSSGEYKVYKIYENEEFGFTVIDEAKNYIELTDTDGNKIDSLSYYYGAVNSANNVAKLMSDVPVYAYRICAPYLSSNLNYRKVVDSYAIVSDTNVPSAINLCTVTNSKSLETVLSLARTIGKQVDYEDYSYNSIDYRRYTLPHTQVLPSCFFGQFICFSMYNAEAVNSVLTQVQFVYHLGNQAYGGN